MPSDDVITNRAIASGLNTIVLHTSSSICICSNHQFVDGVSGFSCTLDLFDQLSSDSVLTVPTFGYVPALSELSALPSIRPSMISRQHLTYAPKWQSKHSRSKNINVQVPLRTVKFAKRRIGRAIQSDVSFSGVVAGLLACTTFSCIPSCQVLSVGVIVAFRNDSRFNNYGIITVNVSRTTTWARATDEIESELRRNRSMTAITYMASNVYDLHNSWCDCDILLSSFPLSTSQPICIKGVPLSHTQQFLRYNSKPIYVMCLSCTRYSNFSFSIRCPQVNLTDYQKTFTRIAYEYDRVCV